MNFRYVFTIAKLAVIILAPITLMILPADFFDNGESVCISKVFFDVECYACGMTRACMHLIHFEFEEAFAYHMMSFIVVPLLAVVWVQWFIKERKTYLRLRPLVQKKHAAPAVASPEQA